MNTLKDYGVHIICGAKYSTDSFSKMLPYSRRDEDEEYVLPQYSTVKGQHERKQISEVARKQSTTFEKIKKPSITHTKCIMIRTNASSPHM